MSENKNDDLQILFKELYVDINKAVNLNRICFDFIKQIIEFIDLTKSKINSETNQKTYNVMVKILRTLEKLFENNDINEKNNQSLITDLNNLQYIIRFQKHPDVPNFHELQNLNLEINNSLENGRNK